MPSDQLCNMLHSSIQLSKQWLKSKKFNFLLVQTMNSALLSSFHTTIASIPAPEHKFHSTERPRVDYNSESSREILKRLSLYRKGAESYDQGRTNPITVMGAIGTTSTVPVCPKAMRLLKDIQLEQTNIIENSVIEEASSMTLKSIHRQSSEISYDAWVSRRAEIDQALGLTTSVTAKSFNEILNSYHVGQSGQKRSRVLTTHGSDVKYQTATVLKIIRDSVAYFSGTYSSLNQDSGVGLISNFIDLLSEWSSHGQALSPNFLDSLGFIMFLCTQKWQHLLTPVGRYVPSLCYLNEKYRHMIQAAISGTGASYLEWRENPNIQFVARFLTQLKGPKSSLLATRLNTTSNFTARGSTTLADIMESPVVTTYSICLSLFMAGFYEDLVYLVTTRSDDFSMFLSLKECMLRLAKALELTTSKLIPLENDICLYLRANVSNLMHEYERVAIDIANNIDYEGVDGLYRLFLFDLLGGAQDGESLLMNLFGQVVSRILLTDSSKKETTISTMISTSAASRQQLLMSKNQASKFVIGETAYSSLLLMDISSYLGLLSRAHQAQIEPFAAFVCLRILETRCPSLFKNVYVDLSEYYSINPQNQLRHMQFRVENIAALIDATSVQNFISQDGKVSSVALLLSTLQYYLRLSGESNINESHLSIARLLYDSDQVIMLGLLIHETLPSCKFVHKWLDSGSTKDIIPLFYLVGALTVEYYKKSRLTATQLYYGGDFYELAAYSHIKYMFESLSPSVSIPQTEYTQVQTISEDLQAKLPRGELHQVLSFATYLVDSKVQLFGYKNMEQAVASFSRSGLLHTNLNVLPQIIKDYLNPILQYSYQLLREVRLVGQQDIREPVTILSNLAHQCGRLVDNSIVVDIMSLGTL